MGFDPFSGAGIRQRGPTFVGEGVQPTRPDSDLSAHRRRAAGRGARHDALRLEEAIELRRGSVTVVDPSKLVQTAGFDENYLHRRLRIEA